MKNQKRILVVLVSCLMFSMILIPCASAELIILPRSSEMIKISSVQATPLGGGRIDTQATIESTYVVDSLGFSYIRLQELQGSTWTTVKSVSSKYASNTSRYTYTFTYYGTPGSKYRAQAGFYVSDGADTETSSKTSSQITCY